MALEDKQSRTWRDWIVDRVARIVISVLLALPHPARVATMGWLTRNLIGPVTGFSRRVHANLNYIWPDMPRAERRRIARQVLDNTGRVFIESYAVEELLSRAETWVTHGPGLDPGMGPGMDRCGLLLTAMTARTRRLLARRIRRPPW